MNDNHFHRYPKKDSEHLLGEVIQKMLTETHLARPYLERRVSEVWKDAVGPVIAQYTQKVELKGDTLYVYMLSPLVKNELMLLRDEILVKMHRQIDERQLRKLVIR